MTTDTVMSRMPVQSVKCQSTKQHLAQKVKGTTAGARACLGQGILKGKFHCTIDLLFDWFVISCMTTDKFCFYLQNRLFQTSQTGGRWYNDTSPFSIPCLSRWNHKDPNPTLKHIKSSELHPVGFLSFGVLIFGGL